MDVIKNNPDKPWHPFPVKQNPNVDIMFFIKKFKHFRWEALWNSPNMSMHQFKWFLEKYENGELGDQDVMWRIKDIWHTASKHPKITPADIEEHLEEPWDWTWISHNPSLTKEFIVKYEEKINWAMLSLNKFEHDTSWV